jgi:hypothetical protein
MEERDEPRRDERIVVTVTGRDTIGQLPVARTERDVKTTATERHVLRLARCPNIHVAIEVPSAK